MIRECLAARNAVPLAVRSRPDRDGPRDGRSVGDGENLAGCVRPGRQRQHEAGHIGTTMTGILDRPERGGWISRERDPSDRRAVQVRALRDRGAEIFRLYGG